MRQRRSAPRSSASRRSPGRCCRSITSDFQGLARPSSRRCQSEPAVAIAISVVYIVLGMLYESYIHPLTILSGLPSAGLGAHHVAALPRAEHLLVRRPDCSRPGREERDHADRRRARPGRQYGKSPEEAIYEGYSSASGHAMTRMPPCSARCRRARLRRRRRDAGRSAWPSSAASSYRSHTLYLTPVVYITCRRRKTRKIPATRAVTHKQQRLSKSSSVPRHELLMAGMLVRHVVPKRNVDLPTMIPGRFGHTLPDTDPVTWRPR